METTTALRRQIELAEELASVTGTMKSLAAVTVHQYEFSLHALHEYVHTVELGLQILLRAHPEAATTAAPTGPLVVVAMGSSRGLCGPLNRHVAAETDRVLAERAAAATARGDDAPLLAVCGARLASELEGIDRPADAVIDAPHSAEGIRDRVDDLLVGIDTWSGTGRSAEIVVVHPRTRPGGRQYEPVSTPVFPLDPARLEEISRRDWATRVLPTWRGDWQSTFAALGRQLLFADLHRGLAETQVCVNRARLAAMQGAEDNIAEHLEELSARFHRQRHAAITAELFDVVAGYEAAGGSEPGGSGR